MNSVGHSAEIANEVLNDHDVCKLVIDNIDSADNKAALEDLQGKEMTQD